MSGISHKQAQHFLRADLDGLLTEAQRLELETHLHECEACRVESESLSTLTARLKNILQSRWDRQDSPSENVLAGVLSQRGKIIMSNRIRFGLRTLAGIGALIVLGFLINFAFAQLRNPIDSSGEINPTVQTTPGVLIAFVLGQENGNEEIFTIKADGTKLTNLTNNPATDFSPAWSPDGTHIVFNSDRGGDVDIYVMDADGSNLTRLTDDRGYEGYFSWSPDGQKIVYSASDSSLDYDGQLIIMNADGSNKTTLTDPGSYIFLSWSPDGRKIIYQKQNLDESDKDAGTYIVEIDGTNQHKLSEIKEAQIISWADPQHFLVESFNNFSGGGGFEWSIYRYDTDSTLPLKISTFGIPIVALFDTTYVVERQEALMWYPLDGAPTPLSSWSLDEVCKTHTDPTWKETTHYISPDKKLSFIIAYCWNGPQSFLLINEDGKEFHQLGMPITGRPSGANWSPDGKFVTVIIGRFKGDQYIGADLYLFDIEKMLNDPTLQPIQLTSDGAWKDGAAWQPQP